MPKCAGTSFSNFLRSVFDVRADYVGGDHVAEPERFEKFKSHPFNVRKFTSRDCLVGHYNLKGIYLWERYPMLEETPHRKFSIIRDPWEAAKSGIRYGVHKGWLPPDMPEGERIDRIMRRANYFSRVFGVKKESEIDGLFEKYWFIAPMDRIDHAMEVIRREAGREGIPLNHLNKTSSLDEKCVSQEIVDDFREASRLDYAIYERARLQFGKFSAQYFLN